MLSKWHKNHPKWCQNDVKVTPNWPKIAQKSPQNGRKYLKKKRPSKKKRSKMTALPPKRAKKDRDVLAMHHNDAEVIWNTYVIGNANGLYLELFWCILAWNFTGMLFYRTLSMVLFFGSRCPSYPLPPLPPGVGKQKKPRFSSKSKILVSTAVPPCAVARTNGFQRPANFATSQVDGVQCLVLHFQSDRSAACSKRPTENGENWARGRNEANDWKNVKCRQLTWRNVKACAREYPPNKEEYLVVLAIKDGETLRTANLKIKKGKKWKNRKNEKKLKNCKSIFRGGCLSPGGQFLGEGAKPRRSILGL